MKASDLKSGNYIEKDDIMPDALLTIQSEKEKEFKNFKGGMDKKCILGFKETEKEFVCNITNFKRIATILKEDDSRNWIGKQIVLWYNEDIEYQGDIVGGIRVRASARSQPSYPVPNTPQPGQGQGNPNYVGDNPPPPPDDGIPF